MKTFKQLLESTLMELKGDVKKYQAKVKGKKEPKVKIPVKNPGILGVPEGKNFWDLPLSHYEGLVKSKGYKEVIRALTNLVVWNKNDDPDISKKASNISRQLKVKFRK